MIHCSAAFFLAGTLVIMGRVQGVCPHAGYHTAVLLDFDGNKLGAELELLVHRLSISFEQTVDQDHFPAEEQQLGAYVLQHMRPVTFDGKPFEVALDKFI